MTWHTLDRGGTTLHGRETGTGMLVVFQHGLGGSEAQVAGVFPDGAGFRRLTLDCRGHGRTRSGEAEPCSIASFADDVLAFADARGVERFVAGGISMGAAIALRLAARHPARVTALVLARPAWLWETAPANMRIYAEVAGHLHSPDRDQALAEFEASPTATLLAREAPDNLVAMRAFLATHDRAALATLLAAIANDGPGISEAEANRIQVPTLVIGNASDVGHPFAYAELLAAAIPGARLQKITSKSVDRDSHASEFREAVAAFLAGLANRKDF